MLMSPTQITPLNEKDQFYFGEFACLKVGSESIKPKRLFRLRLPCSMQLCNSPGGHSAFSRRLPTIFSNYIGSVLDVCLTLAKSQLINLRENWWWCWGFRPLNYQAENPHSKFISVILIHGPFKPEILHNNCILTTALMSELSYLVVKNRRLDSLL